MTEQYSAYYNSPVGVLEIRGSENGVSSVWFSEDPAPTSEIPSCLFDCVNQLDEYFNRRRREFAVKLDLRGSEFQSRVWSQLQKIPYGTTVTYLDIARGIGASQAVRAVGAANGQNPVAIIVPCHRVVGSDGRLTGYGGGLWRKEWLLNFERKFPQLDLFKSVLASKA